MGRGQCERYRRSNGHNPTSRLAVDNGVLGLRASTAAAVAKSARQQYDCEYDQDDQEHGHLPTLS